MSSLLTPPPRRLRRAEGTLRLGRATIEPAVSHASVRPAVDRLRDGLAAAGIGARLCEPGAAGGAETSIAMRLSGGAEPVSRENQAEAYRLEITPAGIEVEAPAPAGLYYAAETLLQWIAGHAPGEAGAPVALPAVRIEDRPHFRHRGFLLDISRNRVPTLDSLLRLVDMMAGLKLNQLQLYLEHTFAYRGHQRVWRDASPLTEDDVRALDAHCRRRHVELVPNQNSFGHLHRWLRHDPYRALAEMPEGLSHPFSDEHEPFSLCPVDPAAIDFLRGLYDQLLPLFSSRRFNVGCDETIDLGKGRSAEACRQRGTGRVYLEFLRRLRLLAAEHGRRIQFWGDILAGRPELLGEVPEDAVVLEWGYEAGHPFEERAAALAAAGLDFYLCPGTSSWISFGGRLQNALDNLVEAARAGAAHGAAGYLITDWGDFGHLQPPPISWPALLAGAALAWNPEAADPPAALHLDRLLDLHAEPGMAPGTGAALVSLGEIYLEAGVTPMNASALAKLVLFWQRDLAGAGLSALTVADLERAGSATARVLDHVASLATETETARLVADELTWVARLLRFACRLGSARIAAGGETPVAALPGAQRRDLGRLLGERIEELHPIWHARSRPGGFQDSRRRLEELYRALAG